MKLHWLRIAITERLINEGPCSNVLEIGSGDFSFKTKYKR